MSYNPETLREAAQIMKLRRENNLNKSELRRAEVYKNIPDYSRLNKETISFVGEYLKNLGNNDFDIDALKKRISNNSKKKSELLKSHGYPDDYMEDRFDCGKCKDTGYVGREKCDCFKRLIREIAASKSNLNAEMLDHNFSQFDYSLFSDKPNSDGISPKANMKSILKSVTNFINEFENPGIKSLLFTGKAGVGKTFLASCIAKEILDRDYDVYYQSAGKITEMIEEYKFRKSSDENLSFDIDRLYKTDLLIIDDLGCEFVNSYTISALYELLNKRLMNKKKMIITTNFSLKELNEVYAERLFSRFVGEFEILEFIGEDLRIKKIM